MGAMRRSLGDDSRLTISVFSETFSRLACCVSRLWRGFGSRRTSLIASAVLLAIESPVLQAKDSIKLVSCKETRTALDITLILGEKRTMRPCSSVSDPAHRRHGRK